MKIEILVILFIFILVILLINWWYQYLLWRRRVHKQLWQRAFCAEDFNKVDQILIDICNAFMLSKKHRYALRPSDDLKVIYGETAGGIDSFQYEHLTRALEEHFRVTENELMNMNPLTVETLIRHVVQPVGKSAK